MILRGLHVWRTMNALCGIESNREFPRLSGNRKRTPKGRQASHLGANQAPAACNWCTIGVFPLQNEAQPASLRAHHSCAEAASYIKRSRSQSVRRRLSSIVHIGLELHTSRQRPQVSLSECLRAALLD